VLAVLVSCTALTVAAQRQLLSRSRMLEQERDEVELRGTLLLGLREGMELWAADEDWTVDHPEEDWFRPREWTTSSGVTLRVQLRDAQDRWNLNHLSLPVTPGMVRTPRAMFQDLLRLHGEDPRDWRDTLDAVEADSPWFATADLLALYRPDAGVPAPLREQVVALPHPKGRFLPLNLNTVQPEVLEALVGDSLRAWVDRVAGARTDRPIRSVASQTQFLPGPVRMALSQGVTVRSSYAQLDVVAETGSTRRELTAWLVRNTEGTVEVLQCHW
jgi:type II secretory pathway component PulK